jgi:hypothetical protein
MISHQRRRRIKVLGTYVRGELGTGQQVDDKRPEEPT